MIASATGLPVLSRKTPAHEGAGEELLVGTSRKKTSRQIAERLKKGMRRKSKAARMLLRLSQSRLRTFLVVPLESSRRTVGVPRRLTFMCFIQKNVEVMQNPNIAHGAGQKSMQGHSSSLYPGANHREWIRSRQASGPKRQTGENANK